jgi:spoIIIJ-associated protein
VRPTIAIAEEEDRVEIHLDGDNLGILIGPKGATLLAIQDLTRTFVQHRTGARNGRLHLDIARYREKRSKALAAFADKVAREVLTTGRTVALEPMSSPDRKVVHDTVAQISGVESRSEGEDDRRHVVLSRQENPTTPAEAVVKPDSST